MKYSFFKISLKDAKAIRFYVEKIVFEVKQGKLNSTLKPLLDVNYLKKRMRHAIEWKKGQMGQ